MNTNGFEVMQGRTCGINGSVQVRMTLKFDSKSKKVYNYLIVLIVYKWLSRGFLYPLNLMA